MTQPSAQKELPTALLVDDDRDQLEYLAQILSAVGFQVLKAENPLGALEMLAKASVNVLITDFAMPNIKSVELARHARTIPGYAELPVLVLSAAGYTEWDLTQMIKGPAIKFCSKTEFKNLLPDLKDAVSA